MSNIIVANNHCSNIGDAFYQLSIIADLRNFFPASNVISGEEASCHVDSLNRFYVKNVFNYSYFGEADWYVLSGPILNSGFGLRYGNLLKKLKEKNVKLVLISVGGLLYSNEEVNHCRQVLEEYPPYILSTRDAQTFENYYALAKHSYNGICSAFYTSFQFQGYETPDLKDYVVYAFDQYLEPKLELFENISKHNRFDIEIHNDYVGKKFSKLDYIKDFSRKYPEKIGRFPIIRLQHDTLGKKPIFVFRRPNTFLSLNSYAYYNLIKNASLVLGTRTHASVIALSYQVPTMLFQRLGLESIVSEPVILEKNILQKEHSDFSSFLQSAGI